MSASAKKQDCTLKHSSHTLHYIFIFPPLQFWSDISSTLTTYFLFVQENHCHMRGEIQFKGSLISMEITIISYSFVISTPIETHQICVALRKAWCQCVIWLGCNPQCKNTSFGRLFHLLDFFNSQRTLSSYSPLLHYFWFVFLMQVVWLDHPGSPLSLSSISIIEKMGNVLSLRENIQI